MVNKFAKIKAGITAGNKSGHDIQQLIFLQPPLWVSEVLAGDSKTELVFMLDIYVDVFVCILKIPYPIMETYRHDLF